MSGRLASKVAIVVGAGQTPGDTIGNGRATAILFAREGARVVCVDRKAESAAETVAMIESEGATAIAIGADATDETACKAFVAEVKRRFDRIDVLHNNVGIGAGDNSPSKIETADWDRILDVNLKSVLLPCKAVLPVMREQRSGTVVTITSTAGVVGQEFCSAYAASKFGLEGWMESLRFEVEPFGIHTTIVEPGFFRTTLLEKESTTYAELSIDDYADRTARTRPAWEAMSGKQGGDPAKLAKALVTLVDDGPPLRWVAGADAVATVEQKANELLAQVDAYRDLSSSLAVD